MGWIMQPVTSWFSDLGQVPSFFHFSFSICRMRQTLNSQDSCKVERGYRGSAWHLWPVMVCLSLLNVLLLHVFFAAWSERK